MCLPLGTLIGWDVLYHVVTSMIRSESMFNAPDRQYAIGAGLEHDNVVTDRQSTDVLTNESDSYYRVSFDGTLTNGRS